MSVDLRSTLFALAAALHRLSAAVEDPSVPLDPELSDEAENAAALALVLSGLLSRILEHDPAQDDIEAD